jgi:hypothetical protein
MRNVLQTEMTLFEQLKPKEIFATDDYDDLIIGEDDKPIVIGETKKGKIDDPEYPELEGMDNRIPQDAINGYEDVFQIDEGLRRENIFVDNLKILTASDDGIYQGHVWIWFDDKYYGLYGIRTSLSNYILKIKGIASALLDKAAELAGNRKIIVANPLESMVPLLTKRKFESHQTDEDTELYQFLKPVTSNYNYWSL